MARNPHDDLRRHIDRLSFAQLTFELSARGVDFNDQAPHDDLRDALAWDIATDEGCEAYLATLVA